MTQQKKKSKRRLRRLLWPLKKGLFTTGNALKRIFRKREYSGRMRLKILDIYILKKFLGTYFLADRKSVV